MAELGGSFERGSGERQGGSGEPEKKRRKIQDSMGQKSRLDLEKQLSRKRTLTPVAQCPGMLDLGGGERKELTFDAIAEEYKKSDGGKTILAGETLVLPVVDYVKNKFKLKPVDTMSKLKQELLDYFHELKNSCNMTQSEAEKLFNGEMRLDLEIKIGVDKVKKLQNSFMKCTDEKVVKTKKVCELERKYDLSPIEAESLMGEGELKPEVKEKVGKVEMKKMQALYDKYRKWECECAEMKVKDALSALEQPGLIIRGVQKECVWRSSTDRQDLFAASGFNISKGRGEYDIQAIFADGDKTSTVLVEVKNPNMYPWDDGPLVPNSGMFDGRKKGKDGSWGQLAKSYTFLSQILMDMELGTVRAFTALPNISRKHVEEVMEPWCHQWVLCKEDLQPDTLRARLGLASVSSTPRALEQVCAMAARLVDLSSSQYLSLIHI